MTEEVIEVGTPTDTPEVIVTKARVPGIIEVCEETLRDLKEMESEE